EDGRLRKVGGRVCLSWDVCNSWLEAVRDGLRACLDAAGPTDPFDVLQDVDQVVRVEGQDLRRSRKVPRYVLDIPQGGGAHLAKALRQNQARLRGRERLRVDVIERTHRLQ